MELDNHRKGDHKTLSFIPRNTPSTVLHFSILLALCPPVSHASDEVALSALISATGNSSSPLVANGWGSGDSCDWQGVGCNQAGQVISLDLANNRLNGVLPGALDNLEELVSLDLSGNSLYGELPSALGELTKLESLSLDNNGFEGAVPVSFARLTALRMVDLRYNRLESSGSTETDSFLDNLQILGGNDWSLTQTVTPENLQVDNRTIDSISLSWDPIEYQNDGGYYEIFVSDDAYMSETEDEIFTTADKSASSLEITGLRASKDYYFSIRSYTENPGSASVALISELGKAVSEFTLRDSDNDGIADNEDSDADNDGISNTVETETKDTDADGVADYLESNIADTDGDGNYNYQDDDDDNDGVVTLNELGSNSDNPADSDGDGIPDYLDIDSDNIAGTTDGSGDSDLDGLSDLEECPEITDCADTDGDGISNYMDQDDDNDGIPTANEGTTLDSDSDTIINALEPNNLDTDGDGNRNYEDDDDDNDGVRTQLELKGSVLVAPDIDGDNIPDYLDADSDNTADEPDGSGDSDEDGISDYKECPNAMSCPDANGNRIPSYMDSDEKTEIESVNQAVLDAYGSKDSGGGTAGMPFLIFFSLLSLARRRLG